MERRIFQSSLRAEAYSSGARVLKGYAARYGVRTTIGGAFHEVLAAQCFSAALARKDETQFLVDHKGQPMARTKNGTLKLGEDRDGLFFSAQLPNTTAASDLFEQVRVGNMDECSFAFAVGRGDDTWDDSDPDCEDDDCNLPLRTIKTLRLFDVSVVGRPAYPQTSISTAFAGTDASSADDDDKPEDAQGGYWNQNSAVIVSVEARERAKRAQRTHVAREALSYAKNLLRANVRATRDLSR